MIWASKFVNGKDQVRQMRLRTAILAAAAVGAGLTSCSASQPTVASPARTSSPQPSSHVGIDPEQSTLRGVVPAYKPSTVELAGDGTYQLKNMKWQVWSISEGIGTGTAGIDDCSPSCANGHWYYVPGNGRQFSANRFMIARLTRMGRPWPVSGIGGPVRTYLPIGAADSIVRAKQPSQTMGFRWRDYLG